METKLIGLEELLKEFKTVETLPQKIVTKSALSGAKIPLAYAKINAPEDTGTLRRGLKVIGEKTKTKGKKAYQVVFDRAYNDVFVKIVGGKRYYYPASQEYGFKTRNGGYVPGYHFLEKAMTTNKDKMEKTILDTLINELNKVKL